MVSEEEGDCIVCLEMRANELMRRLKSGELTNYRVVRTSSEPLQNATGNLRHLSDAPVADVAEHLKTSLSAPGAV
jgi:hypothetical protein